jgi:hypothetical protein
MVLATRTYNIVSRCKMGQALEMSLTRRLVAVHHEDSRQGPFNPSGLLSGPSQPERTLKDNQPSSKRVACRIWVLATPADLPSRPRIASVGRAHGVRFGIGGVTDPRQAGLAVDPAWTIGEQRRLGSTGALLSRHFRAPFEKDPDVDRIAAAVAAIHTAYDEPRETPARPDSGREQGE